MLSSESDKKLFLIDAYALIFRAYYAFIKNPRINTKGVNTSAVFGFTNALLEIIRNEKPTHICVVFDPPGGSFRNEVYEEYKANRDETPEDIKTSVPLILKVLEGLNIPMIMRAGYEADDMIGTLSTMAEKEGFDVYMMTPDKDFGQLVTDKVKMYRPGRGKNPAEIWGPAEVCARFGLDNTNQVIDYLGLMGDASDNIPGVPGVGAKTASKLLLEYGSIEGLYENTDKLKGKLREKVEENHDKAMLSKHLATIVIDIDVDPDFEDMKRKEIIEDVLQEILEELEFKTLQRRLLGGAAAPATTHKPAPVVKEPEITPLATEPTNTGVADLFSQPEEEEREPHGGYSIYKDVLEDLVAKLKGKQVAIHPITTGFDALSDKLIGLALSSEAGKAVYVKLEGDALTKLKPLLEDESTKIVAANYKFVAKILAQSGIRLSNNLFDIMVAHYLIDPDSNHKLDQIASTYLGLFTYSLEDLLGKGRNRKTFIELGSEVCKNYSCESADLAFRLVKVLEEEIERVGMTKLMNEVEFPLTSVLAEIELNGVKLDTQMLVEYSNKLGAKIDELSSSIIQLAGEDFNVDSPKQLGTILFDNLKITDKAKKTKTGQYQTGEDVLKKLLDKHDIVGKVLEYRKLKKLLSTYVDPLPKLVNEATGRVHTHYMQTVASTGRLSSKDPNLQNIPIRTEEGRQIRKAFIPADDNHVLLAADYSQVELRVAAAMSGDPGLCEAFEKGIDIHSATAAKVFNIGLEDVNRTQRSQAKAVNFGILYGQGVFGLAEELGIKRAEAKTIISSYNEQFSTLGDFTKACIEKAREHEYAETILGRRRKLPDINSSNGMVKAFAERNAVNAPIQGSAADVIKVAMVKIAEILKSGNWETRMIMQVHDELVFDVPRNELEKLKPVVKQCMEEAVNLSIPLDVDMSSGKDWLEAH